MLERIHPKTALLLADAKQSLLAFTSFPRADWRQIWDTNPLERPNRETKRRTDVVGMFPNPETLGRLTAAVLVEQHGGWAATQPEVLGRERPEGAQPTRRPRRGGDATTHHHLKHEDRPTRGIGSYATPRDAIMNCETIRYELARESSSVSATFEATFFVVDLRIPDQVGRYMVL